MARVQAEPMKTVIVGVLVICFLHLNMPAAATDADECSYQVRTCTCPYGDSGDPLDVDNTQTDHRTVGLAAATGVLGGVMATGTALAAYFHFRGGAGGGGCGGVPGGRSGAELGRGGGGGGGRGGGEGGRGPSPDSSGDSHSSNSPLTRRDKPLYQSRLRPFTGASTSSNGTNIYRQPRVWPGRFDPRKGQF